MLIAVAEPHCRLRRPERPEDEQLPTRVYSDGRVWAHGDWARDYFMTAQEMRQLEAHLEFGGNDFERLNWIFALEAANRNSQRRADQ